MQIVNRRALMFSIVAFVCVGAPVGASAQTATFHLHKEASTNSGWLQLKTAGPDAGKTALQSVDLRNHSLGDYPINSFDTQIGVPGDSGVIPSGSIVSFKLWMTKSAAVGVMIPRAVVRVNGPSGALLCTATGATGLTTTSIAHLFSCTTTADVQMTPSDRFYVAIGVAVTTVATTHRVEAELDIEGKLNAQADSIATIPLPLPPAAITSLTPAAGPAGTSVTIAGSNFGAAQGASTVRFNGVTAVPVSWSATTIVARVPTGTTSGPVTVTVGGLSSNAVAFTVIPPPVITSVTPSVAHVGDLVTIAGENFLAAQGSSVVTFNGVAATVSTWSNTSIAATVPAGATTGSLVVTVSGQPSNAVAFTVIAPATLAGTVSRAATGAPVAGATVQLLFGGAVRATTTTSSSGAYSFAGLDSNTYDIRVAGSGFSPEIRQGISVAASTTSRVDVTLWVPGSVIGTVTRADGTTAIAGAAVTVYAGAMARGTTNTGTTGEYALPGLHPGSYTVRALSAGYRDSERVVSVDSGGSVTASFALEDAAPGTVLYAYDAVGRLIQVTNSSGESAIYRYDEVGNVLAIERPGTTGGSNVAISDFTPASGAVGATIMIAGTGFSAIATDNIVAFNGTPAPVLDAKSSALMVAVPPGATTGAIAVASPSGTATSGAPFRVTSTDGAPTIAGLTPTIALAGTPIAISGSNFQSQLPSNRVTLNDTTVDLTAATPLELSGVVPPGTLGGRIAVTTPFGTATSAGDLFIPPSPYTPSQVLVADRLPIGTSRSISIAPSGKIALLLFDADAGQHVSLGVTNVAFTGDCISGSFTVRILRPDGSMQAISNGCSSGLFIDQQTLPVAGTYTILVSPSGANTGSMTLTLYAVADPTGPIVADGAAVPVSITTPGQNARFTFSGAAGQIVSATSTSSVWTNCQFGGQYNLVIVKPDGTNLSVVSNACGATTIVDHQTLPVSGTYTLFLDPYGVNTGTATLAVYNIVDVAGSIATDGVGVPVTIASPGQNARLQFTGVAGQIITASSTSSVWTNCQFGGQYNFNVVKPDGSNLIVVSNACGAMTLIDHLTLPVSGSYTLVLDPYSANTGTATLALFTFVDVTGPIAADGTATPVTITAPGQNARLTFSGAAGQAVSIWATNSTFGGGCINTAFYVSILRPDGSLLKNAWNCGAAAFLDQTALPVSGTYTVLLDPQGTITGSVTLALYTVVDVTGPIAAGGAGVLVTITTPGQNGRLTFTGTAGQVVSASATSASWPGCVVTLFYIYLLNPDGSVLSSTFGCFGSASLRQKTLPVSGTYTIRLDPTDATTGSGTVSLTSP